MVEAVEVKQDGSVTKRNFDRSDFPKAAEFINAEYERRKSRRFHLELQWADIDRQLSITPDIKFKYDKNGWLKSDKIWMPESALPDQAQTSEVLKVDARRMMLPAGDWFNAHVELTDEYLARVDPSEADIANFVQGRETEFKSTISGDENNVLSFQNQENADKLHESFLEHYHRQYDFVGEIDKFNFGAFAYGTGLARMQPVRKPVFWDVSSGTLFNEIEFPKFVAKDIRNVYLDDSCHRASNEGIDLGPAVISRWKQLYADLLVAAKRGSNDPNRMDGGWMPGQLKGFTPDQNGQVEILEYEGDIVIPRKTVPSVVVRQWIWTVVKGQGDPRVIRLRKNPMPYSSYLYQPYHIMDLDSPYGTGPIMMGRPIQAMGDESLNRLMSWAALNVEPPISYDRDDAAFEAEGGPRVEPGALWRSLGRIQEHQIGDGSALMQLFSFEQSKYADVTGTQAPRLGAEVKSHTTAFANEASLARGQIRTVGYTDSALANPMTRFLYMEFAMAKKLLGGRTEHFYSRSFGIWMRVRKSQLADRVAFEVFGAGGPLEERTKRAERMNSVQMVIQLEILRKQAGLPGEDLNLSAIQQQVLREGGWVDVDVFFTPESPAIPGPNVGTPGGPVDTGQGAGPTIAALQAIEGGRT